MAKKRRAAYKCLTNSCRKKINTGKYCSTCRSRMSRAKDPIKYAYYNNKNNAKRRGKYHDLTLEQFREFCVQTEFVAGQGRSKESHSIDCIENDKGYTIDNIAKMPLGENARKGTKKILDYDWYNRTATVVTKKPIIRNEDDPF